MANYKKSIKDGNQNRAKTSLDVKYSYSGSDVKGWWVVENDSDSGFKTEMVESLSTVSVQVYEPVGRARALGSRGVRGYASSVREIAGTIVVTVIDDNPLKGLLKLTSDNNQKVKWSRDMNNSFGMGYFSDLKTMLDAGGTNDDLEMVNRIAPLIPTFNLFLEYVSEYYDPNSIADYNEVSFKYGKDPSMNLATHDTYISSVLKLDQDNRYIGSQLTSGGNRQVEESAVKQIKVGDNSVVIDKKEFKKDYIKKQKVDWSRPKNNQTFNLGKASLNNSNGDFNTVGVYIEGIRFISEGIVTSVNDMVTEISYQFIAQDIKPLSKYNRIANQFDGIQNAILRKLSDPESSTYEFLKELENRNDLDEQNVDVIYDTNTEEYSIVVKTDEGYDNIGFTTNASIDKENKE